MKEFLDSFFNKTKDFMDKRKESQEEKDDTKFVGGTVKINDVTEEKTANDDKKIKDKQSAEEKKDEIPDFLESQSQNGSDSDESSEEETVKYPSWKTPEITVLNPSQQVKQNPDVHKKNARIIEETLKSFKIMAKVTEISVGPRVVQYALSITVGTRVSRISSLGNDLALALAAPSGSVRIVAPIPGTSLIGIEMPNNNASLVAMREVVESDEWTDFSGNLPLIFGKGLTGKIIIKDLTKMPHLLIAGATGSGKSVLVNALLCGMLMKYSPDYIKFILVDPKMVELPPYNGIPHLLTPVITDVEKVVYSLDWLIVEMKKRFRIFNKAGIRNIQEYNQKMGYPALPYICLVVDEMADLMLTSGVDVENKIVRLAQMARATGIHLILATQRPSVDVITGLIKANIPARVGMNVATSTDSRVILDMNGAENLLGNGDMLFRDPSSSRPFRIQGAFLSNEEISRITKHARDQAENHRYNKEVIKPTTGKKIGPNMSVSEKINEDPLFRDAVRVVVNAGKASSSLLQRKLRIGYNRAARLTDALYAAKVIGPQDGSKPRDVLISSAQSLFQKMDEGE
jgi:S-DNA-T family DNA segregation ATPase FtsK/SpoIIIE